MSAYGYSYETGSTARRFTNVKRTVKGITIHHWGSMGSSFNGIIGWFCNPSTSAMTSAHYVAQGADANGATNRRVACIVAPSVIAWHAGVWQANVDTIGIECRPEGRDVDYDVIAELVARLWVTYGIVPLYPHKHWVTTQCPGRYDVDRIKREATVKYATLTGKPTTPPPPPETDMPLNTADLNAIKQIVLDNAGKSVHQQQLGRSVTDKGNPLTFAISSDRTYQATMQITALSAAVNVLAASVGADAAAIHGIVEDAVDAALAQYNVTPSGS